MGYISKGFIAGKVIKKNLNTYGKTKVLELIIQNNQPIYEKSGGISFRNNPVPIKAFGRTRDELNEIVQEGHYIYAEVELRGHEYEGKYYVDLVVNELDTPKPGVVGDDMPMDPGDNDEEPF